MAGPHPPNHTVGGDGPTPPESQPLDFPHEPSAGDPAFTPRPTPPPDPPRPIMPGKCLRPCPTRDDGPGGG